MKDRGGSKPRKTRQSLPVDEWPEADRLAWQAACRPTYRLRKGGSASHLAPVSQTDIAARYGRFLGFLKRIGRLDVNAPPAPQLPPPNLRAHMADFPH